MTISVENSVQWILGTVLILSSLGVILARKPVHASLSFLVTLISLSALYLELSAQFISVMQLLVYAGAILVLFMFVMVLFQDAYLQIDNTQPQSAPLFLALAGICFSLILLFLSTQLNGLSTHSKQVPNEFGTVQSLGEALYIDFFFPFEAVTLLFLIAVIGALYIGKKAK